MYSSWNRKYWDIIRNIYWTPRYIGFSSIPQKHWIAEGDRVCIPKDSTNPDGPLYARKLKYDDLKSSLAGQEEILNHLFNLTFGIASDQVISRLICEPLQISDPGPFLSLGSEVRERYKWGLSENVTQQDGFFVSQASLIGVELKLGSVSWPEQIAKYVALMTWEEAQTGTRANLGLLFIAPEKSLSSHWNNIGLTGPTIDRTYLSLLNHSKLPKTLRLLFEDKRPAVVNVLDRLRLSAISWTSFRGKINAIESELDATHQGDQTLQRLLSGFRTQLEEHRGTGIVR